MKNYVLVYANPITELHWRNVLLIEKQKPQWMRGALNLLGGLVEPGEEIIDAALRELKEESGLDRITDCDPMIAFDDVKLMGFIDCNDCVVNCVKVDVCHNQKLEPRPEECEKVAWYDWTTVMDDKRLMPNLRIIIPLMMADVDGWTLRGYEPTRGSDLYDVKVQLLLKQGFMSVKR